MSYWVIVIALVFIMPDGKQKSFSAVDQENTYQSKAECEKDIATAMRQMNDELLGVEADMTPEMREIIEQAASRTDKGQCVEMKVNQEG